MHGRTFNVWSVFNSENVYVVTYVEIQIQIIICTYICLRVSTLSSSRMGELGCSIGLSNAPLNISFCKMNRLLKKCLSWVPSHISVSK